MIDNDDPLYMLTVLPPIETQSSRFVWLRLPEQVHVVQVETGQWAVAVDYACARGPVNQQPEGTWRHLETFDQQADAHAMRDYIRRAIDRRLKYLDLTRPGGKFNHGLARSRSGT